MTVVVHPESNMEEYGSITLDRELQAIRAAILYADEIEVVSPASEMLLSLNALAQDNSASAFDILRALDADTLDRMTRGKGTDAKAVLNALPVLLDPRFDSILETLDNEQAEALRKLATGLRGVENDSSQQLRDQITTMIETAGGPELAAATRTRVVKLKPLFNTEGNWDEEVLAERYAAEVMNLLADGSRHMLLDQGTTQFARVLINEKRVEPSALALPNALEALVGTGVIARLPTFGETPADELLDLRRDLAGSLSRYRRAAASLGEKMRVGPLDDEVQSEVDHLYRKEIVPTLEDIREQLAEHGLVREFARAVGANIKEIIVGGAAMPGLVVGIHAVTDLAVVATAGLTPGVAGAAALGVHAWQQQREAVASMRGNDLYYLHELDRRMA
ncbi:hypothetical protein [Brachybacterium sp. GU-2]|uniref:hypothetical protein n=1 Tax=Brachybacterium sp. GU-2 TaxID=3069708 RepID=UPI00280C1647|nr:hypothetical protein [Brachybacterium sp. GU-2]WME23763.1 hypothetical protein RBL05_03220 [Brachybacterium sp. GU-2]